MTSVEELFAGSEILHRGVTESSVVRLKVTHLTVFENDGSNGDVTPYPTDTGWQRLDDILARQEAYRTREFGNVIDIFTYRKKTKKDKGNGKKKKK